MTFVALFVVSNHNDVTLMMWPWRIGVTLPMALLLILVFVLGGVMGGLWVWLPGLADRAALWRLRRTAGADKSATHANTSLTGSDHRP